MGVAKAGASKIKINAHSGGTGAAAVTSIKNTGLPSELGLIAVDNALKRAGLRDRIILCVSGSIKTGMDCIKFTALGADEFEMGTTEMVLAGCKMLRLCNVPGGCTPGIANSEENFKD